MRNTPKYQRHERGQAFVEFKGFRRYIGPVDSPESWEVYHRLIAEWLAGRPLDQPDPPEHFGRTVNELLLAYWRHAESFYVKHGKPTSEQDAIRSAIRVPRKLYGSKPAADFGPLALAACRDEFVRAGLCRKTCNAYAGKIRRAWKWGVSQELIPETVSRALYSVEGLRNGKTPAPERPTILPADLAAVNATLGFTSAQVAAMARLQLASGMRPSEVCMIRGMDLNTSGAVWWYTPESHKTEHHGRSRVVLLGPEAQALLKPWLRMDLTAYLFSPREATETRMAARRAARRSPMTPSQRARKRKADARRRPGDRYTTTAYDRAIRAACIKAKVDHWAPNQLRHHAGTRIRAACGSIEASRVILGHSSAVTSEIYAERDLAAAAEIMARIG